MALLWFVIFILFSYEAHCDEEIPRVFCGRDLADARLLYCFGSDERPQKKSIENIVPWYPRSDNPDYSWPMLSYDYAHAMKNRGKRVPGLVDECCFKPCYVSELLNYC